MSFWSTKLLSTKYLRHFKKADCITYALIQKGVSTKVWYFRSRRDFSSNLVSFVFHLFTLFNTKLDDLLKLNDFIQLTKNEMSHIFPNGFSRLHNFKSNHKLFFFKGFIFFRDKKVQFGFQQNLNVIINKLVN